MRRILILMLALVAGVATFVVLEFRQKPPEPVTLAGTERETINVLIFARDLSRGTLLDEGALIWQEQLLSSRPEDAVTSVTGGAPIPENLLGKLLRRDVIAGEHLRPWLLVDGSAGFMALTLSPGMRAIAIPITTQKLAGGFILPDDRVDVIHTSNRSENNLPSILSQTILENVRVLAIGTQPARRVTFQTTEQQNQASARLTDIVMTGETITLEVTDAEAELLLSSALTGQVSLALRALEDHGPSRIASTIGLETASSTAQAASVAVAVGGAQSDISALPLQSPTVINEGAVAAQLRQSAGQTVRIISGGTAPRLVEIPQSRNGATP